MPEPSLPSFFLSNSKTFFFSLFLVYNGVGCWVCRRLLCQGATLMLQGRECGRRLLMSHSLLYRWSALMLVRAAHMNLTIRDITVWFWFGDCSCSCGRWCGRAPCSAGWLAERVLEFFGYTVGWGSLKNVV